MVDQKSVDRIESLFPIFLRINEKERKKLYESGQVIHLPPHQMLMQQNQYCRMIPFVISGRLRIFTISPNGREMTLFRTGPGDTCLLSIACQIKGQAFPAMAEVEERTKLFMLPVSAYHQVLAENPAWKDFLIVTLYGHLSAAMQTLEAVAFSRTDRRLAEWLITHKPDQSTTIRTTHEAIAVELGTAREVVSRLLGELKSQGAVALGRGRIDILNPDHLQALAEAFH